jgi:hypothetical protein
MNKLLQLGLSILLTGFFVFGDGKLLYIELYAFNCQKVYKFDAPYVYLEGETLEYYHENPDKKHTWKLHDIKEIHLKQKDQKPVFLRKINGYFKQVKYPSCNLQM